MQDPEFVAECGRGMLDPERSTRPNPFEIPNSFSALRPGSKFRISHSYSALRPGSRSRFSPLTAASEFLLRTPPRVEVSLSPLPYGTRNASVFASNSRESPPSRRDASILMLRVSAVPGLRSP